MQETDRTSGQTKNSKGGGGAGRPPTETDRTSGETKNSKGGGETAKGDRPDSRGHYVCMSSVAIRFRFEGLWSVGW